MITVRRQLELESIFLISIVAAVSLFFVVQRNNQELFNFSSSTPVISSQLTQAPKEDIYTQISPDGTKKVIMRITNNNDNTKTFSFYTADESGNNERFIFGKTLDMKSSLMIPFNTWSPNNQYFFIQENTEEDKRIYAYPGSGLAFPRGEEYFDVTASFKGKNTGNKFNEATGWASESLIIINTTKENGKKGPSYWFEIPSKAIIQLSTEF